MTPLLKVGLWIRISYVISVLWSYYHMVFYQFVSHCCEEAILLWTNSSSAIRSGSLQFCYQGAACLWSPKCFEECVSLLLEAYTPKCYSSMMVFPTFFVCVVSTSILQKWFLVETKLVEISLCVLFLLVLFFQRHKMISSSFSLRSSAESCITKSFSIQNIFCWTYHWFLQWRDRLVSALREMNAGDLAERALEGVCNINGNLKEKKVESVAVKVLTFVLYALLKAWYELD